MGDPSSGRQGLGLLPMASVSEGWLGFLNLPTQEPASQGLPRAPDGIVSISHQALPVNMLPTEGLVPMKDTLALRAGQLFPGFSPVGQVAQAVVSFSLWVNRT